MDLDRRTETQIRLLSESRNRAILDILDEADGALCVAELADRIVSHDVTIVSSETYEEQLDRTRVRLHHERLPKLAAGGLIEYDRDAHLVAPTVPDVEWEDETRLSDVVATLSAGHGAGENEVGVIHGRESIIQHERQLSDEAEEELFTMYVSTDLIDEECVQYAKKACARGVTMCVGSQDEVVRQLSREHVPEAIIWEPQLDWINTPTYPRIGRLVLVDRRKVVLAILDEPPSKGDPPEETALIGDGEENPLVVLVRELLGPRLDHLDYQSDEFRSEFPSNNDDSSH